MLLGRAPDAHDVLVDQGLDDQFLASQLHPEALEGKHARLTLRRHPGYDHSIQSFVADHLAWHAERLSR